MLVHSNPTHAAGRRSRSSHTGSGGGGGPDERSVHTESGAPLAVASLAFYPSAHARVRLPETVPSPPDTEGRRTLSKSVV
ncbi:MAG TPA: hypothetical protein VLT86_11850 [Vicinamibacterales bacterium]|nr:hypothetical protein [Vicinamibacterales bacterium]